MTTIVYRDGVLAADTRGYSGNHTPVGNKTKIFNLEDGSILGLSSPRPGLSEAFRDWLENGSDMNAIPKFDQFQISALRITSDGDIFYYDDSVYPSGPLRADYFAIGSGDHYAFGALYAGATAIEAVEAAGQFDSFTNQDVESIKLNEE